MDLAVLWGADRDQAELEMMDVLEFEFDLANVRSTKSLILKFFMFGVGAP